MEKINFYSEIDYLRLSDLLSNGLSEEQISDRNKWQQHLEIYGKDFAYDLSRLKHSSYYRLLAGKTQIYPHEESDFFRNRLTHSHEVEEVARIIVNKINSDNGFDTSDPLAHINLELISFACFAHDIGHPPFGHVGERVLDEKMSQKGRFEGNAQSLRIITKLIKDQTFENSLDQFRNQGLAVATRQKSQRNSLLSDQRLGINPTIRSVLSILKYDKGLTNCRGNYKGVSKGYYESEKVFIELIKDKYSKKYGTDHDTITRTIECNIMDLADDIAYTTYDLEDALKSGFVEIIDILSNNNDALWNSILGKVEHRFKEFDSSYIKFGYKNFNQLFIGDSANKIRLLKSYAISACGEFLPTMSQEDIENWEPENPDSGRVVLLQMAEKFDRIAREIKSNGYCRTAFTSRLVKDLISEIKIDINFDLPLISKVIIPPISLIRLEFFKQFISKTQVTSARMQTVDVRGRFIVEELFDLIQKSEKNDFGDCPILPEDFRFIYNNIDGPQSRDRVICDFISSMTNRYALEYFGRIRSESPSSFFKY